MLQKAAALLLVGASLGVCVSCNSSFNSTSSHYLYAALPASDGGQIGAYREDPNSGVLTQLTGSPITAGPAVESIVVHPSKKYLYAANSGATPQGNVSVFSILSGGGLQEMTPRPSVGTAPTLLAMDAAGSFLYVADAGSNDIYVFSIDSSTGLLTQVGTSIPIGFSPINMKLAPSGNFMYITGQESQGFVEVFTVNAGAIAPLKPASVFTTGNNPYGLAIAPGGGFLYTGNKLDNSISEFTINADGSLTQLPNSPLGEASTFAAPSALLIDKSGTYLYVANQGSSNLAGYSIGSDGSITLLSTSPFGTGSQPSSLATDPGGKHLFVGNQSSPAVQSFSIDTSSGTLTSVQSYSVTGTPTSMAVTP
jgi:6-phosphogluconolactonase (cycloisomerase 2 family)